MKHCISCLIYYIQSFPILHNFKHPPFLFIENSQEIIQKCLLIMEPLFDWMQSWLDVEIDENQTFNKNHPLKMLSE